MIRRLSIRCALSAAAAVWLAGCNPARPFFLHESGDLAHYLDVATEMAEPDVSQPHLAEVEFAERPLTITNPEFREFWDMSLEEAVSISLHNSKVIRSLGQVRQSRQLGQAAVVPPELLTLNPDATPTVFDPAIQETDVTGVEAALSAFDAQFATSVFWEKSDRPQNTNVVGDAVFSRILERDQGNFQAELSKRAATGTQWFLRNVTNYDQNNNNTRATASDWFTAFEMEARHPLLRGGGAQVNRVPVMLARIRSDITLADFEAAVRNHVADVERSYWDLYFFYRNLHTAKVGRDSALATWKRINARLVEGTEGGSAGDEAQSREQYFFFRSRVEEALRDLYKSENRLRYLLGLAATDGRLIRPSTDPTLARIQFEWQDILCESLVRSAELRRQRWRVKQHEMELIAARNQLLPQLDAVALYRWLGVGDDLISGSRRGLNFPDPAEIDGSLAFDELTEGDYQEWRLGLNLNVPIGFRRELATVRHHQLLIARAKARLEDMELEVTHQMTDAVQTLDSEYVLAQTNFNRLVAAERQVAAVRAAYEAGRVPVDLLLDAQRRRADAEIAHYQSVVEYNLALLQVHLRKGSLLEYNGILLAEGPWPEKAYSDALTRARQRDASQYLNYGYTRPGVISRGPVQQHAAQEAGGPGAPQTPFDETWQLEGGTAPEPELIPTPAPVPTPAGPPPGGGLDVGAGPRSGASVSSPSTSRIVRGPALTRPDRPATAASEAAAEPSPASPGFEWGSLGLD